MGSTLLSQKFTMKCINCIVKAKSHRAKYPWARALLVNEVQVDCLPIISRIRSLFHSQAEHLEQEMDLTGKIIVALLGELPQKNQEEKLLQSLVKAIDQSWQQKASIPKVAVTLLPPSISSSILSGPLKRRNWKMAGIEG